MSPFDFINAINFTKENLFNDPQAKKDYAAFIVNRGLSYFPDTVMYANEMNRFPSTPEEWQFSYFLNSIAKKKRFSIHALSQGVLRLLQRKGERGIDCPFR
jgi:hypothetical protein